MSDKDRFYTAEEAARKVTYMGMGHEEIADLAVGIFTRAQRLEAYGNRLEEAIKFMMENSCTEEYKAADGAVKLMAEAVTEFKDLIYILYSSGSWVPTEYNRGDASVGMSAGYESAECHDDHVNAIMEYLPDNINQVMIDMACEE